MMFLRGFLAVAALAAGSGAMALSLPPGEREWAFDAFLKEWGSAAPERQARVMKRWTGRLVTFDGEAVAGGLSVAGSRETVAVVAPDRGGFLVALKGREGEWEAQAIQDVLPGRRILATARIEEVDGRRMRIWASPAMVRSSGRAEDLPVFLDRMFEELERGTRLPRGFEGVLLALLEGHRQPTTLEVLSKTARRDFPFERESVGRIREAAVGMLGRAGRDGAPYLRLVAEHHRKRTDPSSRRVFVYAVINLGDAGDRAAWEFAKDLDRSSDSEVSGLFMLFERSRDLLPKREWTGLLKLAGEVSDRGTEDTATMRARAAVEAHAAKTWGSSPRHRPEGSGTR